ncbi:MAG: class I SAM-dependent methyltransferase [Candidatus Altiarchaeota archaeon]|nr:class I SAM-dependent methyltransferase [Candidatus Altiarchaeota archaeon]
MVFAQYKKASEDWFKRISSRRFDDFMQEGRRNSFIPFVSSMLQKDAAILEAGSSFGRYVKILREQGFVDVRGIEISRELMELGKSYGIEGIDLGSVLDLPYPENTFGAYVDFGTIEHFRLDDQEKILSEAGRVLKSGGLIFIDVPYMNRRRRRIYPYMFFKNYARRLMGHPFHQWIYTLKEAYGLLEDNGFTALKHVVSNSGVRVMVAARKR